MVEASGESIPHQTRALTAGEVGNLADRLLSRAVSTVFAGTRCRHGATPCKGGLTMSPSIHSSRDLLITFERDGAVTDRQVSSSGFDAVTTALSMIGRH